MASQIKSLVLSDSATANLSKIADLMQSENVAQTRKQGYTVNEMVHWAVENFFDYGGVKGGRPATGTGSDVLARVHDVVTAQMQLNKTTDKTVTVGKGKNSVTVKYEQRAITDRWIRDSAGVNAEASKAYIESHKDEIDAHNAWLISDCGYPAEVENFNRRTGKASAKGE